MFDEITEITNNYNRDRRVRAAQIYQNLFDELGELQKQIQDLPSEDPARKFVMNDMKKIAGLMQELNHAVCAFEHERISELADECPASHAFGIISNGEYFDETEALVAWLKLHFPQTWPS